MQNEPYTYWTLEYYDVENGIRGGGGLGVLAADTRRVAEQMDLPFVTVTPFYPRESHQVLVDGRFINEKREVNYRDFGFKKVGEVKIRCNNMDCPLTVIQKELGSTRIVSVTEPNFGELYQDMSGSDHRLYQEVALGFGGYQALELLDIRPMVMQLNEVATFFAGLKWLDELVSGGMDFYEAMVQVRAHVLYTNHTLVQAAEAQFSWGQFERFVYPNLKSVAVRHWLDEKFAHNMLKLSVVTIEIAGKRNGVSKLHAKVADYHDVSGEKVEFRAITNGIDMEKWVLAETLEYYWLNQILDSDLDVCRDYRENLEMLDAKTIRELKDRGREVLNEELKTRPDQNGEILQFGKDDFIFDFKRRFVDYKRPDLAFLDIARLRRILERRGAHYILTGRVHTGDARMMEKLMRILRIVREDNYLRTHVHYLADYDEKLAFALSVGSNAAINTPIVGLEACGTSWEKDVANLNVLISTHDGGVADAERSDYLSIIGETEEAELTSLYANMNEAIRIWDNDEMLESTIRKQLAAYLPVISGARMMREYLDFMFEA